MSADRARPGVGRKGARRRALRLGTLQWRLGGDLLALTILGAVLTALLSYVALLPPTDLAFAVDRQPPQVLMRDFYGFERNEGGAFRWSKPDASLIVPVNAPADYRITLALQDTPAARPRRPLTVSINGRDAGAVVLDDTLREYTFAGRLPPGDWRFESPRALIVELQTAPFVPPGDPRPLGVIVAHMSVAPAAAPTPWQPALALPYLLALPLVYAALRRLRAPPIGAAGAIGLLLAAYATLALSAREAALLLAYLPLNQPLWALGAILFAPPLALMAYTLGRVADSIHWPNAAQRRQALAVAARRWRHGAAGALAQVQRADLIVFPIVLVAFLLRIYAIDLPGPYADEVTWAASAQQMRLGEPLTSPNVRLFGRQFPTSLAPHTGAFPVYPVFVVSYFTSYFFTYRVINLCFGLLLIAFTYLFARDFLGRQAALLSALMLTLMPTAVIYSRVNVTIIRATIPAAALYFFYRWYTTERWGHFYAGCFALGLGLSVRLEMAWWIVAIPAYFVLAHWRGIGLGWQRARGRPMAVLVGATWFLLGSGLFVIYNLTTNWATVSYVRQLAGGASVGQRAPASALWQNLLLRINNLGELLSGPFAFTGVTGFYANALYPWVFYAGVLYLTAAACRARMQRSPDRQAEFLLLTTVLILLQSTVTTSGFVAAHIVPILPLPVLIIAAFLSRNLSWRRHRGFPIAFVLALIGGLLLWDLIPDRQFNLARQPAIVPFPLPFPLLAIVPILLAAEFLRARLSDVRRRALPSVLVLALLGSMLIGDIVTDSRYFAELTRTRGVGSYSSALFDLATYLETQGESTIVSCDWGLSWMLHLASDGRIRAAELFGYSESPPPEFFQQVAVRAKDPKTIYVFYAPPFEQFKRRAAFVEYLQQNGLAYEQTVLHDANGPVYFLYRIPPSGPANNATPASPSGVTAGSVQSSAVSDQQGAISRQRSAISRWGSWRASRATGLTTDR